MNAGTPTPDADDGRWPVWRLALLLYPFAAGAVAINMFMIGLMGGAFGWGDIPPVTAIYIGLILGVPATIWCGKRLRALMDEADGR